MKTFAPLAVLAAVVAVWLAVRNDEQPVADTRTPVQAPERGTEERPPVRTEMLADGTVVVTSSQVEKLDEVLELVTDEEVRAADVPQDITAEEPVIRDAEIVEPMAPVKLPQHELTVSITWYDGKRATKAWLNPRVLFVWPKPMSGPSGPPVTGAKPIGVLGAKAWLLPEGTTAAAVIARAPPKRAATLSPGYHVAAHSRSRMQSLPGGVVLQLDPKWSADRIAKWARRHKVAGLRKTTVGPGWHFAPTAAGTPSLELAKRLRETGDLLVCSPNWWRPRSKR